MLMLIQKLVKEEIQENVDINDWREVRKAYYLYTFISFLLVAERTLNECFGDNKNVVGRNLVSNAVYVTTNRVLSGEERLFVSKEFKVGELRCTFVLQPMVENRKGMCANGITSDLNE